MVRAINWARYDRLKAQGHSERDIANALDIPRTTLRRELAKRQGPPAPVQKPVQAKGTGAEHSVDTRHRGSVECRHRCRAGFRHWSSAAA
jgi:transposase